MGWVGVLLAILQAAWLWIVGGVIALILLFAIVFPIGGAVIGRIGDITDGTVECISNGFCPWVRPTRTPTPTATLWPTRTPTETPTMTPTATLWPTRTPTATPNATQTPLVLLVTATVTTTPVVVTATVPTSTAAALPTWTAQATYTPFPTWTAVPGLPGNPPPGGRPADPGIVALERRMSALEQAVTDLKNLVLRFLPGGNPCCQPACPTCPPTALPTATPCPVCLTAVPANTATAVTTATATATVSTPPNTMTCVDRIHEGAPGEETYRTTRIGPCPVHLG